MGKSKKIISTLGSYAGYKSILNPLNVIVDIDGNEYTSVIICSQEWLVENLKTTKYRDGTPIPNITDGGEWIADSNGAYCWYNNDIENKVDYGALYNHFAVSNAHGLAIEGWRVPSADDLAVLMACCGGMSVAGGKLKEVGLTHWKEPNEGATDEFGFKGLPGGFRHAVTGNFGYIFQFGIFYLSKAIWNFDMNYYNDDVTSCEGLGNTGYTIRCMRDI